MQSKIVIVDGATGSNLQKGNERGEKMPFGVCPEKWIVEHPDALIELQRAYVKAGSQIVYAPTFGANRIKLKDYGLEKECRTLNEQLVAISKEAVGDSAFVAGDMTMTGQQLAPLGSLTFEEMFEVYREQAQTLAAAGADLIVVETMMSLAETRAAVLGVKAGCELPLLVTMSFGENGKTLYGTDPQTALLVLQGLGADAVGINCSAGPDRMLALIRTMAQDAAVPLIVKPNAGLPKLDADGNTVYDMGVEEFAGYMEQLLDAGASVIGGCCGTDPSYIEAISKLAAGRTPVAAQTTKRQFLTTERASVEVTDDLVIGTIAPDGDEELAEEYAEGFFDTLLDRIDEQIDEEVDVICLSADGEGLDAKQLLPEIIAETMQSTSLPLAFSSDDEEALREALRVYPGRAGIVVKDNVSEAVRTLCQQYGAVLLQND